MSAFWSFLASLVLKLVGPLLAYLKGSGDEQTKQTKEDLEAMRDAKDIHDRIDRDPVERQRVRDKYR